MKSAFGLMALTLLTTVTALACSSTESAGSLVVYSGRSESLVGPIIDQFKEATGIDVKVKYGSTSELAATLLEEGTHSPADVFFAQEPGGLIAVRPMLSALPQETLALVPAWARSPEGDWAGISGRARVVVYNNERVSAEDLPDSMMGFTEPQWRGRLGWAPNNASFQTMVGAMRRMWGEEKTREWLKGMLANDPRLYPKNTPIVAATAAGEIDAGFVNHYYLFRFIEEDGEDFPARNHYLSAAGPGSLVMVSGAGILDTSGNRANAERFIDFLLSETAQQYFASETFEYPLVPGVEVNRLLTPLEDINSPDVDASSLADIQDTQRFLRDAGVIP